MERGTVEIAQALTAAGHRAIVASAGGRLEAGLSRAGAEHVTLPLGEKTPWGIRRNGKALAELIREETVDVVHARSRAPAWAGLRACEATGTPFVTTYHGAYSETNALKKQYNAVMAKGQPTIAISEFIAGLVTERYGLSSNKMVVIPRGADIHSFAEEAVSSERTIALAERWGVIDDPRPIVLLPARLGPRKGHSTVLQAARHLLDANPEADFTVVFSGEDGGSGMVSKIEDEARALSLQGVVRMVRHTADMEAAYKLSAVVLSTGTQPEAFGRVSVEAQAMGRPVIASAHGGSLETIEDGKTGWLYPPGDAAALADRIATALAMDTSERAHMGLAGRARIRSRFTIEEMQRATLEVYEQAAAREL